MDAIVTFFKENWDLVGLALGVVGVVIGVFSLVAELKAKKGKRSSR